MTFQALRLSLESIPSRTPGRVRLGVMGGTFDPIHHGHLVAASEVAAVFDLDEVVFVPTGQPWQKTGERHVSDPEHRYLMTVIATASNPRFTVSRIDIDRGGATYTFDTLNELRALRPDADLFFITGADAISQIMTWRNAHKLWELANFVGVTRPGHEYLVPDGVVQYINKYRLYSPEDAATHYGGGLPRQKDSTDIQPTSEDKVMEQEVLHG